jgi:hypothetical protein
VIRPPIRLLLTGAAVLVALSLTATACDVSPVAATVNGQDIKQSTLNRELAAWAGDSQYVTTIDANNRQVATVEGQGTGTYNNVWVSSILNNVIIAAALHQRLASTGALPDAATLAASRSLLEIAEPGWFGLSAGFRQTLTQRFADQAAIRAADPTGTAPAVPDSAISQAYNQYQDYFFTSICVLQAETPSQTDAQAEAAAGLPSTDPQTCYDQAQFEDQPEAFRSAVLNIAVGKVAPVVPTAYGFEVVQVAGRAEQGHSPQVQNVLATVIAMSPALNLPPDPGVTSVINQAHVHLNPAYGTWKAPNVTPPSIPNLQT